MRSHCNFSQKLNFQFPNYDRISDDGVDLGDRTFDDGVDVGDRTPLFMKRLSWI
ncbi:MAG: hypothetical protein KME54_08105 [Tolypothrix brevis GSE-NOS-MK-07-07A]|jgi:hypothetical protein|nr:hypothetical protein [Tolypothrix brevis GSE-NOS-MK-07-07A]